jgi:hypothetical protein
MIIASFKSVGLMTEYKSAEWFGMNQLLFVHQLADLPIRGLDLALEHLFRLQQPACAQQALYRYIITQGLVDEQKLIVGV